MAEEICARTCGFCGITSSSTVTPGCIDLYSHCNSTICTDPMAKDICARTCEFCGDSSTPSPEDCSYICKALKSLCEFIDWIIGPIPNGFCSRCQQCK
ncbi:hypothetical protein LOAG_13062 [Loa loa]|nr:hypothetical protein LOAG_13062 [Loa loa]EFO15448.1 hypothetical protein LOAG_13062 [Loa loa]